MEPMNPNEQMFLNLMAKHADDANVAMCKVELASIEAAHPRSPQWATVRHAHIVANPNCIVCGKGGDHEELNVHHIKPYHLFPDLELEPTNLVTLCNYSLHHLWFGHFGNFRLGYNLNVVQDAAEFIKKMALRETGGVE